MPLPFFPLVVLGNQTHARQAQSPNPSPSSFLFSHIKEGQTHPSNPEKVIKKKLNKNKLDLICSRFQAVVT
jgi:hypothetical protein